MLSAIAELIDWQIGFKIFLNITPTVTNWTSDNKQFSLVFEENPLADFVELPDDGRAQDELWYSNILCGVLRGALEMVCCHGDSYILKTYHCLRVFCTAMVFPFCSAQTPLLRTQLLSERRFSLFTYHNVWCPLPTSAHSRFLGANAGGGPFHQRRLEGKRQYRDENITHKIHRG